MLIQTAKPSLEPSERPGTPLQPQGQMFISMGLNTNFTVEIHFHPLYGLRNNAE
jgi:hypothetical protein